MAKKNPVTPAPKLSHVLYTRVGDEHAHMLEQLRLQRCAQHPGLSINASDMVRILIEEASRKLRIVRSRVG